MDGDEIIKLKKIYQSNDAVAGVIEALLLVALFSIVLSTVQLVYIPDIMEQREVEHMDEVENQLSYLKSIIDLQSSLKENITISCPLTLGSRELPYFVTARAFGQIDIIDGGSSKIDTDSSWNISLTSVKYQAINSYFLKQEYILEGGGLIIKQHDGESMRIEPSISYINESGNIKIFWSLPEFDGLAGKNSTSGFKGCYLRCNYSSTEDLAPATNYTYIYTDYLDAWNNSLNQMFEEPIQNNYMTIKKKPISDPTYVEIKEAAGSIEVYIEKTKIIMQIGPGIVIQS